LFEKATTRRVRTMMRKLMDLTRRKRRLRRGLKTRPKR